MIEYDEETRRVRRDAFRQIILVSVSTTTKLTNIKNEAIVLLINTRTANDGEENCRASRRVQAVELAHEKDGNRDGDRLLNPEIHRMGLCDQADGHADEAADKLAGYRVPGLCKRGLGGAVIQHHGRAERAIEQVHVRVPDIQV